MPENTARQQNVLVFFCDQLRLDLLGCYGGTRVRTPNLDALARDSAVFERAGTPCALCSPARASLMTGLYPHCHHMFNNSSPGYSYCEHLRSDLDILPDWVDRNTDACTGYFGKWHIGPADDLFNSSFHHTHPRPDQDDLPFLASSHWHPNTSLGPMVKSFARGYAGTLDCPMERFPDAAAARFTRDFIIEQHGNEHPFLAFCAFPGPHSPWMVPDEFGIRYSPDDIEMWPNRYDTFAGKPVNQKKLRMMQMTPGSLAHLPGGDDELRERLACCFSYLELIDELVGKVIADLRKLGLYDDTAIVFTADHGDMAGAHGFISKGAYMYDETTRIPLLVKPAGKPHARRIQAPVHLMDVTATIMDWLGEGDTPSMGSHTVPMGSHTVQGKSLQPLLEGRSQWPRTVNYAEYHGDWYGHYSARMVSDGNWKLIWNLADYCELYDLMTDPGELRNRFYDPSCRGVRERLFETLVDEARRLDDKHVALLMPEVEQNLPLTFDEPLPATS